MKNLNKRTIIKINHLAKLILFILLCNTTILFAQTHNFVQEDVVRVAGITTGAQVHALAIGDRNTSRTYFDGYGRAIQTVGFSASPAKKDMVQPMAYDSLGRQVKAYLPYTATTATGLFRSGAITEQATFYGTAGQKHATDTKPYSQQVFDNSPLQKLLRAGSVGDGFQPGEHYKTTMDRTNLSGETVRYWNSDGSAGTNYSAGKLSVATVTDEEGNQAVVYTDNKGRAILKKQLLAGSTYLSTYYVYNDAGQLIYTIPPKAVKLMETAGNFSLSQTDVDKLLFRYVYDFKGRLVERTVPGSGPAYMVYDPMDRLVLAQDANLRTANKWNYIKYDSRDVAISQGIYTNGIHTSRSAMQAYVSSIDYTSNSFEERNTGSGTGYYTNNVFPTSGIDPLAYSYFDDYDLDGNGTADFSYSTQSLAGEATPTTFLQGMPTMVSRRTVGAGTPIWLTSVMFYDRKGNIIQTQGNNQLTGSVSSHQTTVPDFIGQTVRTKSVQVAGSTTTTVYSEMTYDHVGRLKTVDEKYNAGSFIRVAAYLYNELGQLIDKKLHSTNGGSSYLQSVDYRYTIRGQLASINNSTLANDDSNDDSNDVFGMNMLYEASDSGIGSTGRYNGLLTAVKWRTNAPGVAATGNERSYRFSYDRLMRLNDAIYADRSGGGSWGNNGAYDEKGIGYDENGNITTLQRRAVIGGTASDVDDLSYSYDGNRLDNVSDGAGGSYTSFGFKNLTGSTGAYGYDVNGNMTSDAKKGLTLSYNILNRTDRITITTATGRYIDYTYSADGVLLNKKAYDNSVLQKSTDYIGGFVYENGELMHFAMAEGRVRNAGGTLTSEYFIKDNQGNVRVSFEDNGGTVTVRQENSYYPFGLSMPGTTIPSAANRNLYNGGSEWQDDFADLPDLQQTFYRNYDPALGRFVAVDPEAEASESLGTYHYALNNPIMFNDPLGNKPDGHQGGGGDTYQAVPFHGGYRRIGAGSGNHWSDGIQYNDWNSFNGSETYRAGLAAGLQDIGGYLTHINPDGSMSQLTQRNGLGFGIWIDSYTVRPDGDSKYGYDKKTDTYSLRLNSFQKNHIWHSISGDIGFGETGSYSAASVPVALTLSASDGPIPIGEAIGAGVVAAAITRDITQKKYITYTLTNPTGKIYVGRSSGYGDPYSITMNRFNGHHMRAFGYGDPELDAQAIGPLGKMAIRGREQQLIDFYGGVGSPNVGNSIRGVARYNFAGPAYHLASNTSFGEIYKYTGIYR